MKRNLAWLAAPLLSLVGGPALAEAGPAAEAAQAARAAEAEAAEAHMHALEAAEAEQRAALAALEAARRELEAGVRERSSAGDGASPDREMRQAQRALENAHENLRRATREVARIHQELIRPRLAEIRGFSFAFHDDRAVIGVILGASDETGVAVLGVSPGGPAEQAGIQPGDTIVAIDGGKLAGGERPAHRALQDIMQEVKVDDELLITVARDGEHHDFTVKADSREPFTWESFTRLRSLDGDDAPVILEHIELPRIDRKALDRDMARLREDLARARAEAGRARVWQFSDDGDEYLFELGEMSELGDAVLAGADLWSGMPLAQGLKLTAITPGLGEYFDTPRGVLVLEARADNEFQLQTGDVILSVDGREVDRPVDVMRALRRFEAGDRFEMEIMRQRKHQTLDIDAPGRDGIGFMVPGAPGRAIGFSHPHCGPEPRHAKPADC